MGVDAEEPGRRVTLGRGRLEEDAGAATLQDFVAFMRFRGVVDL